MLDVAFLLKDVEGRKFLSELLAETGVLNPSYCGDEATEYREGKRALGIIILQKVLTTNSASFTLIVEEDKIRAREKEVRDEREREKQRDDFDEPGRTREDGKIRSEGFYDTISVDDGEG